MQQSSSRIILLALGLLLLLSACHEQEEFSNDPQGNFDALWTIIDEHYTFFKYKLTIYFFEIIGCIDTFVFITIHISQLLTYCCIISYRTTSVTTNSEHFTVLSVFQRNHL